MVVRSCLMSGCHLDIEYHKSPTQLGKVLKKPSLFHFLRFSPDYFLHLSVIIAIYSPYTRLLTWSFIHGSIFWCFGENCDLLLTIFYSLKIAICSWTLFEF